MEIKNHHGKKRDWILECNSHSLDIEKLGKSLERYSMTLGKAEFNKSYTYDIRVYESIVTMYQNGFTVYIPNWVNSFDSNEYGRYEVDIEYHEDTEIIIHPDSVKTRDGIKMLTCIKIKSPYSEIIDGYLKFKGSRGYERGIASETTFKWRDKPYKIYADMNVLNDLKRVIESTSHMYIRVLMN